MADLSNALDKAYEDHISKLFDVLCASLACATSELDRLGRKQMPPDLVEDEREACYARFRNAVAIADVAVKKVRP